MIFHDVYMYICKYHMHIYIYTEFILKKVMLKEVYEKQALLGVRFTGEVWQSQIPLTSTCTKWSGGNDSLLA